MNDIAVTYSELYLYVIIAGAILGALLGLAPLLMGRRRNKTRLGMYGFFGSIIGGAIAPLLALVVSGIFSWLIIRKRPVTTDSKSSSVDRNSSSDSAAE